MAKIEIRNVLLKNRHEKIERGNTANLGWIVLLKSSFKNDFDKNNPIIGNLNIFKLTTDGLFEK